MSNTLSRDTTIAEVEPLIVAGKLVEAIDHLRHHLDKQIDPELLVLWCKLAILTNGVEIPRDLLIRVSRDDQLIAADLSRLAEVERQNGRAIIAEIILETLVEAAPDADRIANLGVTQHGLANLDAAQASFERALALAPIHGHALTHLAALHLDRGHVGDAMLVTRRIVDAGGLGIAPDLLYQLAARLATCADDEADRIAACAVAVETPQKTHVVELAVPPPVSAREPSPTNNREGAVFSIGG